MEKITMDEFLMGRITYDELSDEYKQNANTILDKVNQLLEKFGEFRKCNSGYRSPEDQARINPKVHRSSHMICAAIDVSDSSGTLWKWCMDNMDYLVESGLYLEDKKATPTWVHMQCIPPKSGKHIFIP